MREHFLTINGLGIRYLESDDAVASSAYPPDTPPQTSFRSNVKPSLDSNETERPRKQVVFIHGLGSSSDRWLDIPDALSIFDYHCMAIDLPGFGKSGKPKDMDYTISKFAEVLSDFIHTVCVQEKGAQHGCRVSLIGHSLGGYVAMRVALGNPQLVDRLILIDSSGMLQGPTKLLREYLDAAMHPSQEKVRAVFEQMVADPTRIPDSLVRAFIYRMSSGEAKHAFKSALENSANTQIGIEGLKAIGDSGIPTLILWGEKDRVIPVEHCDVFRGAIRNSGAVIIKDAGHAPFAEKPALVSGILQAFLDSKPIQIV